jgi:hypothetical protein
MHDKFIKDRMLGKKLKHEKLEETKHGLFRDCFLGKKLKHGK